MFEAQKKQHNVRPSLVESVFKVADYDTAAALFPQYLPEHVYLLELPKKKKKVDAAVVSKPANLDLSSIFFGAAIMGVALLGVLKRP